MARFSGHRLTGILLCGLAIALLVILIAVKAQSDREGAFLCKVVAETPGMTMDECPAHQDNTSWMLLAAFGISFLILASGVYMLMTSATPQEGHAAQRDEAKAAAPPVDLSRLNEDERRVFELLNSHEGSMYQSDIIRETGFTKVRTTRVLDKLEAGKVLERKRRGMTNIVILK